jgi:hypothetical protein
MGTSMPTYQRLRRIRLCLGIFMAGLVLSGITAFPLERELRWSSHILHSTRLEPAAHATHLLAWIERVSTALAATNARYPFLAYGTGWLAFAHLVIAIAFIGPYREPVLNKWVVTFGLIACAGIIPLALIAGHMRGITVGWRLIDCSFGIFGAIPLLICWRAIGALEGGMESAIETLVNVRRLDSSPAWWDIHRATQAHCCRIVHLGHTLS